MGVGVHADEQATWMMVTMMDVSVGDHVRNFVGKFEPAVAAYNREESLITHHPHSTRARILILAAQSDCCHAIPCTLL